METFYKHGGFYVTHIGSNPPVHRVRIQKGSEIKFHFASISGPSKIKLLDASHSRDPETGLVGTVPASLLDFSSCVWFLLVAHKTVLGERSIWERKLDQSQSIVFFIQVIEVCDRENCWTVSLFPSLKKNVSDFVSRAETEIVLLFPSSSQGEEEGAVTVETWNYLSCLVGAHWRQLKDVGYILGNPAEDIESLCVRRANMKEKADKSLRKMWEKFESVRDSNWSGEARLKLDIQIGQEPKLTLVEQNGAVQIVE